MSLISPSNSRRPAFTLVELLVVIAIIGILIGLLLPAVQSAREAARRSQCQNNLKQIMLGILTYEDAYKTVPINIPNYDLTGVSDVAGSGMSWMVSVLPFIEQQAIYEAMDYSGRAKIGQGVNRAQNRDWIRKQIPAYLCPSDTYREDQVNVWLHVGQRMGGTNYVGVQGPHTTNGSIFPGLPDCNNFNATGLRECSGLFWTNSVLAPVRLGSISDGLSNTLAVGEMIWEYDWFCAWAISNGNNYRTHAPPNYLKPGVDPAARASAMDDWPNRGMLSRHPGGVQFAAADGSVAFVSDEINISVYHAWSTRNQGEAFSQP